MATRVRVRVRPPAIPNFEPGFTVQEGRGQIDRMKVTFREGAVHASEATLVRIWRQNGGRKVKARNGYVKFIFSNSEVFTATLIARRGTMGLRDWALAVELDLNVTKFAVMTGCRQSQEVPLASHETDATFSLDGNSNFVPEAMLAVARNLNWPQKAAQCLDWAYAQVARMLNIRPGTSRYQVAISERSYAAIVSRESWALSGLEVYWEARCEDALSLVREFEAIGAEIASTLITSYHPVVVPDGGNQRNARVLTFSIGRKAVSLVLYAKLIDRLRLEVRFNSNVRSLLRHLNFSSSISMSQLIEMASSNAAERTNTLLRSAWERRITTPLYLFRLSQFLHAVSVAFHANSVHVQTFLSGITANGRIQLTSDVFFNEGIRWLVRRNYLVRQRSTLRADTSTFAPSRAYAGVIRALGSLPGINRNLLH